MMQNKITALCPRHIPQLAELEKQCFSSPWSANAFIEDLENPLATYCIMEQNGNVLGYVGSRFVQDEVYITNVAVSPLFRRIGIAEQLISALERQTAQRGAVKIMLEARVSNVAAIALYEKLGFKTDGVRKNYYDDPAEDAVLMTKFIDGKRKECMYENLVL